MDNELAQKRVLVLSDNDGLYQAIELNLHTRLGVEVTRSAPCPSSKQFVTVCFDLIVVAVSSPTSEPIVALTKASLIQQIGRIPLLIISDRAFLPDLDNQINHLDFPFDADSLHTKVKEMLQGAF